MQEKMKTTLMIGATALIVFGCGYGSGYAMKGAENPSTMVMNAQENQSINEFKDIPDTQSPSDQTPFSGYDFGDEDEYETFDFWDNDSGEYDFDDRMPFSSKQEQGNGSRSLPGSLIGDDFSSLYNNLSDESKQQLQSLLGMSDEDLKTADASTIQNALGNLDFSSQQQVLFLLLENSASASFGSRGKGQMRDFSSEPYDPYSGNSQDSGSDFSISF